MAVLDTSVIHVLTISVCICHVIPDGYVLSSEPSNEYLPPRYVPRKVREEQPDSFPMNNGLSNRNFKSDTEF